MKICHLHNHTQYSLLDGHCDIKNLIEKAKKLGMTALAITDHGSLFGIIDFYKECVKAGIKPVLGSEFYLCGDIRKNERGYSHLVLLAKDNIGLKNLYKLSSVSYTDGFYMKPRIDKKLLEENSEGLICLTGCLNGKIPQLLLENNDEGAYNEAVSLISVFGSENVYIELQYHKLKDEAQVLPKLIKLSHRLNLKCVLTNDIHYVEKEDSLYQDILMCVSMQKQFDDKDRIKFETDEFYLKSYSEMVEAFEPFMDKAEIESAIKNTMAIADLCNVEIKFHNFSFPKFFNNKTQKETESYFKNLCRKGLTLRYGNITAELSDRLEYEMKTICEMGFCDYFLIVWDFVRYAKTNGIPVGPGRGSAAGSLVSYVLNITTVDPIKYNLVFERFLNSQRVSMPDIDIDFCNERREEVIDYVIKKYGEDRVARIITFGTLKARAAIKDVARVLGMPYYKADEVTKMIPQAPKITIDDVLVENKKLLNLYENDSEIKRLIDISKKIEGHLRHGSVHAAGVLITGEKADDLVPLTMVSGTVATQFEMGTLEELGLLKMDFLGLKNLSIIDNTIYAIKNNLRVEIDFQNNKFDDEKTYAMISKGNTDGVFQLESGGMKRFLAELKPQKLEDIIAAIALYRPGPMAKIPEFIKNKNNPDNISYSCELMASILNETYGCIVYQEQVMEIFRSLAGYTYGQADIVRKAISKKKTDVLMEQRSLFIEGCKKNNMSADISQDIFSDIEAFADYAFNKSHSVCYSMIAYQTAYLKCNYPAYFFASLLSAFMDYTEKVAFYIKSAETMGIKTMPPRINVSDVLFTVKDNSVSFGIAAIKGIGKNMAEIIVNERNSCGEFLGVDDFLSRMTKYKINRGAVEALIKAGCFEGFGKRVELIQTYEDLLNFYINKKKTNVEGQLSFTDTILCEPEYEKKSQYDESMISPPTKVELEMEKEVLGLYISGHPLGEFVSLIKSITKYEVFDIREQILSFGAVPPSLNKEISLVGIIKNVSIKRTKTGKSMAVFKFEDISSEIECVLFPNQFSASEMHLKDGNIVEIRGRVEIQSDETLKLTVSSMFEFVKTRNTYKLYLKIEEKNKFKIKDIMNILKLNHGNNPVYFYYPETKQTLLAPGEYNIKESLFLLNELKEILGEDNVKLV